MAHTEHTIGVIQHCSMKRHSESHLYVLYSTERSFDLPTHLLTFGNLNSTVQVLEMTLMLK